MKDNNSIFKPQITIQSPTPKLRCFTSQSIRKKETMFLNDVPNYHGKHIQNVSTLISLKINEKDVSEFQKPNSTTLLNLKQSQLNLNRNQYNPYQRNYYSSSISSQSNLFKSSNNINNNLDKQGLLINGISTQNRTLQNQIENMNKTMLSQSKSFIKNNQYQLQDNQEQQQQISKYKDEIIEQQQQQQYSQINTPSHYHSRDLISNDSQYKNDDIDKKNHIKESKHIFQLHDHLLLSKNHNLSTLYDRNIRCYKSIFSIDWVNESNDYKQKGFTSINLLIIDLKTQKYNLFKKIIITKDHPHILSQVFAEKQLGKNQYVQEVIIEKMMYRGNLNGYAQLPSDIEKQILLFYFLLAFTLDGHMERLLQVDFALTKAQNFLDLKNQSSVSLSLKKKLIFQAITKKNMSIEDSFRKTFTVDLVRIIGEKVHIGLAYHEQGDEIFKNMNPRSMSSQIGFNLNSSKNLQSSTTTPQEKRQINEVKCFTKSEIVYQNKLKRDLMSSQKALRTPDLIRQHSQQALRSVKTAISPINMQQRNGLSSNNKQRRLNHKSYQDFNSRNTFHEKFPLNQVIELQRLQTPMNNSFKDDFHNQGYGFDGNNYQQQRSSLFSQNSQKKKQVQFNIFSQIVQQQNNNVQRNIIQNSQFFSQQQMNYNSNSHSNQQLLPKQYNQNQGFNMLYHDNKEIQFQDIVPFVNYIKEQPENQEQQQFSFTYNQDDDNNNNQKVDDQIPSNNIEIETQS